MSLGAGSVSTVIDTTIRRRDPKILSLRNGFKALAREHLNWELWG